MDYKNAYIKMRNSGKYELDFFFNYYLSKGGLVNDPNEFTETFLYTHVHHPTPPGFPPIKMRDGEVDRESVLSFLDGVFELTILKNREGKFLKVVE
jgi:hypothetical protein